MSLSSFNEVVTIVLIVADKVSHWSHSYIFLFAWGLVILRGDPGRHTVQLISHRFICVPLQKSTLSTYFALFTLHLTLKLMTFQKQPIKVSFVPIICDHNFGC